MQAVFKWSQVGVCECRHQLPQTLIITACKCGTMVRADRLGFGDERGRWVIQGLVRWLRDGGSRMSGAGGFIQWWLGRGIFAIPAED